MTVENVFKAKKAFDNISHSAMPAKTAYKISKLGASIKDDARFYSDKLTEIIDKYCKRDEDGNPIVSGNGYAIQEDKIDECEAAIKDLREVEASVPDTKIALSELDSVSISPDDIAAIYDFIEED